MEIVATQTNATWGLDRIDQADLPLEHHLHLHQHRQRRDRLHHRHRHPDHAHAVRRTRGRRVRRHRRRAQRQRLQRPRHARRGHRRRLDLRRRQAVRLVAVRVLNCSGSGSTSGVIAGVNFVTSNHVAGAPAVANMSLGGGVSTALDTAVRNSIADGVTYAIAAGNSNANASNSSPARVAEAITVGSSTSDRRAIVVLELRQRGGHLRARLEHHLGVVDERHRDQHDQRHVDGDAARGRRRGARPAERFALARDREEHHRQRGVAQPADRHSLGHRQPAALPVGRLSNRTIAGRRRYGPRLRQDRCARHSCSFRLQAESWKGDDDVERMARGGGAGADRLRGRAGRSRGLQDARRRRSGHRDPARSRGAHGGRVDVALEGAWIGPAPARG